MEKQVSWKEKEWDWSSEHNDDQALSLILFSGLNSSGHGVALPAQETHASGTIAPRSKTRSTGQVLTTGSGEKEKGKTMIAPPL